MKREEAAHRLSLCVQAGDDLALNENLDLLALPKPTRGLEPRTPSYECPQTPRYWLLSHILRPEVCSNHLRFAEFGTYFGTRFPSPTRAGF